MKNLTKEFKHVEGLTDKRILQMPRCCDNAKQEADDFIANSGDKRINLEMLYIKDGEITFGNSVEMDDMIICFIKPEDYDYYYMISCNDGINKTLARRLEKGMSLIDDVDSLDESESVKEVLRRMLMTVGRNLKGEIVVEIKNVVYEPKHIQGLTDKRLVQTCKTIYEDVMNKEPLERAMEYAKMVRKHGTSFERLYIKNNEIYYGDKFECEDMIVCLVDYDCDRFYRIVFGSDDNKYITCHQVHGDDITNSDVSDIDDINTLDETDTVKEVLKRMFISLGK